MPNVNEIVGEFTSNWAKFERKHCGRDCNSGTLMQMTNKIKKFDKEPFKSLAIVMGCRARKQYAWQDENNYIELYVKLSVFLPEAKKNENDEKSICEYVIPFIKSQGLEKLEGAFLAIYRIKNNLTHGFKPDDLSEQMPLFQAMNEVLKEATK